MTNDVQEWADSLYLESLEADGKPDAEADPVQLEAQRIRTREAARELVAAEKAGDIVYPSLTNLSKFLAEPDEPVTYLVDGLAPSGGRTVLAAQNKAGKTTLTANLVRALADNEPFLGQFSTAPVRRILLLDNELSESMLRRWLRDQNITATGKVDLVSLRGRLSTFNILDAATRTKWADILGSADLVIFDCLRPALDALGLDENRDAGKFLEAFDELTTQAGITNTLIVHHMGHSAERSRGDSRIIDWPDANWRLVKNSQEDDEAAADVPRYFTAYGRDVDQPQITLNYDTATRRLTATEGTRADEKHRKIMLEIVGELTLYSSLSKSQLEAQFAASSRHTRRDIRSGIDRAIKAGYVSVRKEKSNRHMLEVTDSGKQFASSPQFAETLRRASKSSSQFAATLKGGELANWKPDSELEAEEAVAPLRPGRDEDHWKDCAQCHDPKLVETLDHGICTKCVSKGVTR